MIMTVWKSLRLSAQILCAVGLAGCGVVFSTVDQKYEHKQQLTAQQAVEVLRSAAPTLMNEMSYGTNPPLNLTQVKSVDEQTINFQIVIFDSSRPGGYGYVDRYINFQTVTRIRERGVVDTPGNLQVTLFDKDGKEIYEFTFLGGLAPNVDGGYSGTLRLVTGGAMSYAIMSDPAGVRRNKRSSVDSFISALLALCPNVR